MTQAEILKQVNDIFIEVFENEKLVINETTTVFDIEEWDSLAQVQLVVAIEKYFKIRFNTVDVQSWNSVAEIINSILKKVNK